MIKYRNYEYVAEESDMSHWVRVCPAIEELDTTFKWMQLDISPNTVMTEELFKMIVKLDFPNRGKRKAPLSEENIREIYSVHRQVVGL